MVAAGMVGSPQQVCRGCVHKHMPLLSRPAWRGSHELASWLARLFPDMATWLVWRAQLADPLCVGVPKEIRGWIVRPWETCSRGSGVVEGGYLQPLAACCSTRNTPRAHVAEGLSADISCHELIVLLAAYTICSGLFLLLQRARSASLSVAAAGHS